MISSVTKIALAFIMAVAIYRLGLLNGVAVTVAIWLTMPVLPAGE